MRGYDEQSIGQSIYIRCQRATFTIGAMCIIQPSM